MSVHSTSSQAPTSLATLPSLATAMPKKTPRGKHSDAQKLLDPSDILDAGRGRDIEEQWDWFSNRLHSAGFQSCGYLISRSDIESPLGHPDSKLFGNVVSPQYLQAAKENPALQSQARPYRMLRTSRKPITFMSEEDLSASTPSEKKLAQQVNSDFDIKAWALFPIHAPESTRIYGLGWWDLENQANARALWEAEASTFTLAATYFAESISTLTHNSSTEEEKKRLSRREMECLLWAGAGKTTAEISAILNVAHGTIDEYFKRAAKKLGATTRAQACVRAVLSGLIQP